MRWFKPRCVCPMADEPVPPLASVRMRSDSRKQRGVFSYINWGQVSDLDAGLGSCTSHRHFAAPYCGILLGYALCGLFPTITLGYTEYSHNSSILYNPIPTTLYNFNSASTSTITRALQNAVQS